MTIRFLFDLSHPTYRVQVEGLLSCCRVQARTLHETLLYDSLMRSAVALQSTVPSPDSLAARRSVLPGKPF
jgi:hypothetical protein